MRRPAAPPPPGPDDTIRMRPEPPAPPTRGARGLRVSQIAWVLGAVGLAAGGALVAVLLQPTTPPPGVAGLAPPPGPANPPASVTPHLSLPSLGEAEILDRSPSQTEAYRFAQAPAIVILQFASFADQAATLNRAAALIERAGFPRDRVLDAEALANGIREAGGEPETFYLGHDYRTADLERFFALAHRDNVTLNPQETWLRQAMRQWGWEPGTKAALISLAREDPGRGNDRTSRATILRHELSHGLYFTDPQYAAYVAAFWQSSLTEAERAAFRAFLGREGYDTEIEDLMRNETQAYLVHTADPRYFNATAVGLPPKRIAALRTQFLAGMPPSWLRDLAAP